MRMEEVQATEAQDPGAPLAHEMGVTRPIDTFGGLVAGFLVLVAYLSWVRGRKNA